MKNRTSLTLVISLLVCTLTAGTFAQTLPPEDTRPSDLQSSAQAENANGQCPYKVVPGDKVYLQIKNVKLRSDNLPLYPYFYVYGKSGEDWKYISGTSSQAGKQVCEKVTYPSRFQFYIDNTYQECFINVYSDYGNQLVAKGVRFNTGPLINWAKIPQNLGKTYPNPLEISKGNTIEIRLTQIRKNQFYYFEIVSYKISSIDNSYKKYVYENYNSWLRWSDKYLYFYNDDKKFTPATEKTLDYTDLSFKRYSSSQREIFLICHADRKLNIAIENKIARVQYEGALDTIELLTNDVLNQLNDCMQKYPEDKTKWVVKSVSKQGSEIELSYAGGIEQKIPENGTVIIDEGSKYIKPEQYAEPDNAPCPYKVTKDDKIYLQLSNVKVNLKNIPLQPYFSLYQIQDSSETHYKTTSAQAGNQINEKVANPTSYQIYFDFGSQQKDYRLDVLSDWGNRVVAKGTTFNIDKLIKWVKNPVNRGGTFELKISNGNTVGLKLNMVKSERYYYFDIVSYKIKNIDEDFRQFLFDTYKSWLTISTNNKALYPKTDSRESTTVKLTFDNSVSGSEMLFSCALNNTVTFAVANNTGKQGQITLSAYEVRKQLNECMKAYPDDHSKWVVKFTDDNNSEIELSFEGIRRIYRITSVSIPEGNPARENPRYKEKGYAPWMRIYIQQNGVPCGLEREYARPGRRTWEGNVPNDKYNRFEIREGTNAKFSLQIKDADTWFWEIFLLGVSNIKDLDFVQGKVYEKLGKDFDPIKRTVVEFEEVKQ